MTMMTTFKMLRRSDTDSTYIYISFPTRSIESCAENFTRFREIIIMLCECTCTYTDCVYKTKTKNCTKENTSQFLYVRNRWISSNGKWSIR